MYNLHAEARNSLVPGRTRKAECVICAAVAQVRNRNMMAHTASMASCGMLENPKQADARHVLEMYKMRVMQLKLYNLNTCRGKPRRRRRKAPKAPTRRRHRSRAAARTPPRRGRLSDRGRRWLPTGRALRRALYRSEAVTEKRNLSRPAAPSRWKLHASRSRAPPP